MPRIERTFYDRQLRTKSAEIDLPDQDTAVVLLLGHRRPGHLLRLLSIRGRQHNVPATGQENLGRPEVASDAFLAKQVDQFKALPIVQ